MDHSIVGREATSAPLPDGTCQPSGDRLAGLPRWIFLLRCFAGRIWRPAWFSPRPPVLQLPAVRFPQYSPAQPPRLRSEGGPAAGKRRRVQLLAKISGQIRNDTQTVGHWRRNVADRKG